MKQSNAILGLVFVGLIAALYFLLAPSESVDQAETSTQIFKQEDWGNLVEVVIKDQKGSIRLLDSENNWSWYNEESSNLPTQVDADRLASLVSLINGLEKYRKASSVDWDESNVTSVILHGREMLLSANGKQTFMKEGNEISEVRIPGYNVFIHGFFNSDPKFWASKQVANSNWQTLKAIQVIPARGETLQLTANDRFFEVEGLNKFDSAKVFNYINLLEDLKARAWLSNDQTLSDEVGKVMISDIKRENNAELTFYRLGSPELAAVKRSDFQPLIIDSELLNLLFIPRDSLQ